MIDRYSAKLQTYTCMKKQPFSPCLSVIWDGPLRCCGDIILACLVAYKLSLMVLSYSSYVVLVLFWGPCRKNLSLRIFVVVILKEGFAGRAPSILLLAWHQQYNIICEDCWLQNYNRCHIKRRIGGAPPANPFLYVNNKDLKDAFLQHATLIWYCIHKFLCLILIV